MMTRQILLIFSMMHQKRRGWDFWNCRMPCREHSARTRRNSTSLLCLPHHHQHRSALYQHKDDTLCCISYISYGFLLLTPALGTFCSWSCCKMYFGVMDLFCFKFCPGMLHILFSLLYKGSHGWQHLYDWIIWRTFRWLATVSVSASVAGFFYQLLLKFHGIACAQTHWNCKQRYSFSL